MNTKSERWAKWIRPQWNCRRDDVIVNEQSVEKPRFVLWVGGGRALYDGEMMGLASLDFIDNETSLFQIRVESLASAKSIISKVTGCVALGLEELDADDGEYREWYDEAGNDIGSADK